MKVCNLGSGSKGNVTYIETKNTKILIDCGLSAKQVEVRLASIGVNPREIDAIFITHEHVDHISGLKQFVKKYTPLVFVSEKCTEAVLAKQEVDLKLLRPFVLQNFIFKDIEICPFELSHDSAYCVGYTMCAEGGKISIATDTGFMPLYAIETMMGSDIIYIESNYNEEILLYVNEIYTEALKRRIMSKYGHLSNIDCADVIAKLVNGGTSQFVLSHLSDKNNTPKGAFMDVAQRLESYGIVEGYDVFLDIAFQDKVGTFYQLQNDCNIVSDKQCL